MSRFQQAGLRAKRSKLEKRFPAEMHIRGVVPEGSAKGASWHYGYYNVTLMEDRCEDGLTALRMLLAPTDLELDRPALVAGVLVEHFTDGTFAKLGARRLP